MITYTAMFDVRDPVTGEILAHKGIITEAQVTCIQECIIGNGDCGEDISEIVIIDDGEA